jgi:hypothetical protein
MAKDKLITLLIEEEKRDRLKQHCTDLGLNVSQVLSKCIDDILSGSIDLSKPIGISMLPLDIDQAIDAAIDKREQKLLDIIFNPTNQIQSKLRQHDDDIHELENAIYTCQTMLKTISELVTTKGIGDVNLNGTTKQALAHTIKPDKPIKNHSSDDIALTIEDTLSA